MLERRVEPQRIDGVADDFIADGGFAWHGQSELVYRRGGSPAHPIDCGERQAHVRDCRHWRHRQSGASVALSGASSPNEKGARAHVRSELLRFRRRRGRGRDHTWPLAGCRPTLCCPMVSGLIVRSGWQLTRDSKLTYSSKGHRRAAM